MGGAQCINGTEKHSDSGMYLNWEPDKNWQDWGQLVSRQILGN